MRRLLLKLISILLIIVLAACNTNPGTSTPEPTPTPAQDIPSAPPVDPVYELGETAQNASGNRQGVYYEIFVRSFADSDGDGIGDIKGLTEKLDYLNDGNPATTSDLGITGIWLMPVNKTVSYHGYDVTDYYDINPDYGTLDDFERLLDEAHKRGISVIMDLVLNHTSTEHEWFISSKDPNSPYRNWYLWTDENSAEYNLKASIWGHPVWNKAGNSYYFALFWSGMPDLNYNNPDVRQEAKNIAGFWLDKGVDGFRLDAVPHLYDSLEVLPGESGIEKSLDWWNEFTAYCHEKKPGSLIIGEVLNDNTSIRASYLPALDSTFHIGLGAQIANAVTGGGSKNNYLSKFIANNYAQYAKANPDYIDAPMLSNHDQNRIITSVRGDHEKMKMAASIYLTLEGIPFIYYGEEIGMMGGKPDEDIRLPYIWGGDDPLQTRWRNSKYNTAVTPVSEQEADPNSLLTHYKRIIRVRNKNHALYAGKFNVMESNNASIVAYNMKSDKQSAIILHNLAMSEESISVDITGYTLEFCQKKDGFAQKDNELVIPPLCTIIYVKDLD
jgi:alpha-amylase